MKTHQNHVHDLKVNISQGMRLVESDSENPSFTILAEFGDHLIGVAFINPVRHLSQDGKNGIFQWRGELAPYQRPRARDAVYLGLVECFEEYLTAIKSGKAPEAAAEILPSAPLILGTEEGKTLISTTAIPVADGGTRLSALCEAAANLKIKGDLIVPFPCHIYEGLSVKEMAGRFVTAQKTRNMNINDAIHAAAINGQFDPVIVLIKDAEARGLFGKHTIVSSREEAKSNPNAILLGSYLEWACWAIFNRSSKKDVFALANQISATAVDTLAQAIAIFTEVNGRKKINLSQNDRGHCLDSTVFNCILARLVLACPLVASKRKGHLTFDELRYWLRSLCTDNSGRSFRMWSEHCRPLCSAGKKGMSELFAQICKHGMVVGIHNNNRENVFRPDGNIPCSFRPELLRRGKENPLYKPVGVRTKERRSSYQGKQSSIEVNLEVRATA